MSARCSHLLLLNWMLAHLALDLHLLHEDERLECKLGSSEFIFLNLHQIYLIFHKCLQFDSKLVSANPWLSSALACRGWYPSDLNSLLLLRISDWCLCSIHFSNPSTLVLWTIVAIPLILSSLEKLCLYPHQTASRLTCWYIVLLGHFDSFACCMHSC